MAYVVSREEPDMLNAIYPPFLMKTSAPRSLLRRIDSLVCRKQFRRKERKQFQLRLSTCITAASQSQTGGPTSLPDPQVGGTYPARKLLPNSPCPVSAYVDLPDIKKGQRGSWSSKMQNRSRTRASESVMAEHLSSPPPQVSNSPPSCLSHTTKPILLSTSAYKNPRCSCSSPATTSQELRINPKHPFLGS
jgi:hypothetical protein